MFAVLLISVQYVPWDWGGSQFQCDGYPHVMFSVQVTLEALLSTQSTLLVGDTHTLKVHNPPSHGYRPLHLSSQRMPQAYGGSCARVCPCARVCSCARACSVYPLDTHIGPICCACPGRPSSGGEGQRRNKRALVRVPKLTHVVRWPVSSRSGSVGWAPGSTQAAGSGSKQRLASKFRKKNGGSILSLVAPPTGCR